ncbi:MULTISPECIES: hypothetical protein [unclassified Thiocapsa]|uniref:hypothetical protein n=1 Tax=unclassified Thiocapsa TaxID=2641286 RepID=UPI0035B4349D
MRRPKLLPTEGPDLPSRDAIVRNPKEELTTGTLRAMLRQLGLSLGELARRPGINAGEARRLVDPRHAGKGATLEPALIAVGRGLANEVATAACDQ